MNLKKKRPLIPYFVSYCIVIIVSIILFYGVKIKFRYPDDYLITAILGGVYGDGSNQYMIPFMSVILTYVLSALGNLLGCFNIYGIFMFLLLNTIFCLVHTMTISYLKKDWLMTVLLILMQIIITMYLTFTVMAYFVIGTAFLWLYCSEKQGTRCLGDVILFLILTFLGIMIRPGVGISALLLMIPIVALFASEKKYKVAIASVIIMCLFSFSIKKINTYVFQCDETWQAYKEWNSASVSIRDYARIDYDDYSELLTTVNWSEEDLSMMYAWIFIDQNKFDTETLITVSEGISTDDRYELNLFRIAVKMVRQPTVLAYIFCVCVFLAVLRGRMLENWVGLLTAATPILAFIYLFIRQRFVERMAIPICLLGLLEMIMYAEKCGYQKPNNMIEESYNRICKKISQFWCKVNAQAIRWLVLIPMIALLIIIGKWQNNMKADKDVLAVKEYIAENKNDLFLTSSGVANQFVNSIPIVQIEKEDYLYNVVKLGSWDSFSGRYYEQLSLFDVEDMDRMFLSLEEGENIYLVVNNLKHAQYILDYIMENYDLSAVANIIETFGDVFILEYHS